MHWSTQDKIEILRESRFIFHTFLCLNNFSCGRLFSSPPNGKDYLWKRLSNGEVYFSATVYRIESNFFLPITTADPTASAERDPSIYSIRQCPTGRQINFPILKNIHSIFIHFSQFYNNFRQRKSHQVPLKNFQKILIFFVQIARKYCRK